VVVDLRAASCEELAAAATGRHVRYAQLGPGRCRCRLVVVQAERWELCFEDWSISLLKAGRPRRGSVVLLAPVGRTGVARIQGRRFTPGEVIVLFDGDEFDLRSAGPVQLVSVSIDSAALEAHVRALLDRHLGELRLQGRLNGLWTDPVLLRAFCLDLAARAADQPRLLRDPALAKGVEAALVKRLFSGFNKPRQLAAPSRGRLLARRAEAWLRQNLAQPPSIPALCAALGAGERTLHEAFRVHLDTTPKAYLKALRLNAARHDLLENADHTRVTDVALDWGFLHFGWFSQDYRRLFGETPSQTLKRSRRAERALGAGAWSAPRAGISVAPA
jgi:AraC family ethanolamine operon transcriptional activator